MKKKVFLILGCIIFLVHTNIKAQHVDTLKLIDEIKNIYSQKFSLKGIESMDKTFVVSLFKIRFLQNQQIINREELEKDYVFSSTLISIESYPELNKIIKLNKKPLTVYLPVVCYVMKSTDTTSKEIHWRAKESFIVDESNKERKIIFSPIRMNLFAVNVP